MRPCARTIYPTKLYTRISLLFTLQRIGADDSQVIDLTQDFLPKITYRLQRFALKTVHLSFLTH